MKKKEKIGRKLLSFLLTLALVLGLMPGMGLTAYAATLTSESTIWSENSVIAGNVTIDNNVTVDADITLTIPEGKILTINGQFDYSTSVIDAYSHTLTVSGGGTLIVNAPAEDGEHSPIDGICGELIVDGATVQVTGGADGVFGNVTVKSGLVCVNGGNGNGGDGISGDVIVNGGSITVVGGNGGNGGYGGDGISGKVIVNGGSITVVGGNGGNGDNGDGGSGGDGVIGDVIVNGGSATITGGNGGTKGSSDYASNGYSGQAVYGSITGNAEESEDNTNWTSVTGSTSTKQYIKIEPILVTGVSLDKTTAQTIDMDEMVSFTATVEPNNAADKTVKWSVGGKNADAVTLYSDETCETPVTLDTATETLTVYAKGISAGNATVTCTSNADSEKSASCNVTVNAYAGNPYASLVNTTTSVEFNDMDWYIIADDSTAEDAGTVTLLSKDPIGASKFHESQDSVYVYSISLVKGYLDSLTGTGGTFEAVADAIVTVKVKGSDSDSEVDAKLWLLSTSEAEELSEDVRKCSTAMSYFWWLRSRGSSPNKAALVYSEDGYVSGDNAWYECGVRPALKLDLSKVTFDSNNKIFELMPVVEYPLWVGGVQVTSANKDDVLGDTDEGATVSYDVDTNKLTLNGVDIAAGYTKPGYNSTSGIYYSGNDSLSIVLSEDSDNKVGVSGNVQIGINSESYITISGAGNLTVKGSGNYSVGIEAYALTIKDAEINVEGVFNGIQTQKYGYGVNIISGKVNAIGQTGTGIHSGMDVNYQTKSAVTIGENATVVAIGGNKAIDYLKNAIAGTGWTDPEDNTSKTTISISSEGQSIDTLKKMAFPKLPASTVTTPPEANNLTFTGSAQELVTAGVASNGEMQYAIGTNTTTEPTTGWNASIPTATNAGTYYVWYKVVGDENHNDTDAANVPVVIAKADPDYTVPTGLTAVYGDTLQDVTLPAGWTWADADQIVGDAGTNTFKANYVPNDVTNYNSVEYVDVTVSVSKGNGAAAVAPEVTAWTSDYVFAEAVNGQEYVIVKKGETPDWSKAVTPDKESVTFTGLTPATEYSIYTRVKETDNTLASEPEKVDVMTSLIGWETRGEAKTGETITIIPDPENAEGLTWQWYYAEENEKGTVVRGEAIKGETSSSYVVKDSDLGKYLYYVISKGGEELAEGYAGPVKININVTVALEGWVYGENPNTPQVSGNTGNGAVTFTYVVNGAEEPESETVPTLPGTYTVFAYVEESGDYAFGYAEADFTIAKGTPAVTAPKARNLVYTGASQELVEAGVAVGGEMQYALGSETVATQPYTTSIPTATDAGTYYVWYKAVGDENHSNSVPACVTVVIESKESVEGEVTFNKGEGENPETLVESVESSDLTEFAETQKEESKEVKVELEITPKREADIVQTSVDGTKQIAEGLFVGFDTEKVVTEYFDIDLTKYVDDVKQDNIADTGSPIEIALKYDKTKMFDPVVVRTHKGETVEFSKLNARPAKADYKDATYYVGDGVIYLYSQFFSDYAIIYSTVKTYNVDIVTGTSDKISKTVAEDSKVDLPTGLSKSGYTFSGWYSDEAYTKVWNANDPVTADTTIYAKWTKNTVPYVPSTPVETPTTIPTPTVTPVPTETPTVTPAPVKDSITAEEAARGAIKLNAGLKVYPKKSDIVVKWGKVDNADRYVIYAVYCKKGRKCAKIATLDGDVNSYKFSELNGKPINTKKNIKLYVVAYRKVNGKYKKITRSITAHIVGSGSKKYSNVKGINVESTKITLSLDDNTDVPSSYTLNPVAVLKDSSKKMLRHTAEFRYATSKSSVATVGKDGTITAKGIGTCYIYVYAQNGYAKKVKVTVK